MKTLKEIVMQKVKFYSATEENLWYETEDNLFRFPVPFADVEGAIFLPEDKGLYFMKWIRKEMNRQKELEGKTA